MAGITNKGKYLMQACYFNAMAAAAPFKAVLITGTVPTADTNLLSQLTECPEGNGYTTGGISVAQAAPDLVVTEDDANDLSSTVVKDLQWTASGGSIPISGGDGISALVLCDDDDNVLAWWELSSPTTLSVGQALICEDNSIRFVES